MNRSLGRQTRFEYDPVGRVISQILPGGKQISFSYDPNGNMTKLVPPGKPEHGFGYNEVDLNDTYTPPEVGIGDIKTKYGYNLAKQPTIVTRPDGKTIGFTYDTRGRLQELLIPEGEITYAYHADTGNLTNILTPGSTMSYTYNGSLLEKTAWSGVIGGNVSVTYNDDLMVTSQSVNDGDSVSYGYDDDGLLTSAGSLTISRDAQNGMMTGSSIGSISDSITYNSFGELERYQARFSGSTVYNVEFGTRDQLGRILTKTETVNGETHTYSYVYDPSTDELTDVYKDGVLISHYDYDANGNRLKYTGVDGTFSGTYDDQDRMLSYGGNTYQYTATGELKSKTNAEGTTVYDYDVLGNLRAVTLADGTKIEYVIDGLNRRIGKKVNGVLTQGFLYQDALNPVVELDGSGNVVARFVYGTRSNVPDYIIKGGVTYRIITDHLGSPRVILNVATGEIVQWLDYDEFGKVIIDTNPGFQPFGFAGGIYDKDTGLVRFGARDYDAEVGRWTCKDPIGFEGEDTNLYSYVWNDSINFTDPEGLKGFNFWDRFKNGLIGGASGAASGAATGAVTGAVVGAFGGAGVGAAPGAVAGAGAGAVAGGVSGFISGFTADPCATAGDVAKSGAISGGISGALGGGGAVAAGWGAKIGLHDAHHTFGNLGKLPHWQLTMWRSGVKGSHKIYRIPWRW